MKIRGNTVGTTLKPEKAVVKCQNLTREEKAQARANIGVNDTLTVTINEDVASHTAAEIYAHVQSGGTAVCKASETAFYNLSYVDSSYVLFSFVEDDAHVYGVKILADGSYENIGFSLGDAISILPKVTTDDNGKFLQVAEGVWVAVDAVPQMQALIDSYIEEKFPAMTQAEYDALAEAGTVDESKYYMIVGEST